MIYNSIQILMDKQLWVVIRPKDDLPSVLSRLKELGD